MLSIAVCEDERYFSERIITLLNHYLKEKKMEASIESCASGEELLAAKPNYDIILMDIVLPGLNGIETMGRLRERGYRGQVIFITAYKRYVFQAFDVDAVHYILKPVEKEKFFSAMEKAIKRGEFDNGRSLFLVKDNLNTRVFVKDILYCEVHDHSISVETIYGQFFCAGTLGALEEQLGGDFFRCHRSYIVNMSYVMDRNGQVATMAGGKTVYVSRRKSQEFERRLLEAGRKGIQ